MPEAIFVHGKHKTRCMICGKDQKDHSAMRRISNNKNLQGLLKNYLYIHVESGICCRCCLRRLQNLQSKHNQMKSLCHRTVRTLGPAAPAVDTTSLSTHADIPAPLNATDPGMEVSLPKYTCVSKRKLLPKPQPPVNRVTHRIMPTQQVSLPVHQVELSTHTDIPAPLNATDPGMEVSLPKYTCVSKRKLLPKPQPPVNRVTHRIMPTQQVSLPVHQVENIPVAGDTQAKVVPPSSVSAMDNNVFLIKDNKMISFYVPKSQAPQDQHQNHAVLGTTPAPCAETGTVTTIGPLAETTLITATDHTTVSSHPSATLTGRSVSSELPNHRDISTPCTSCPTPVSATSLGGNGKQKTPSELPGDRDNAQTSTIPTLFPASRPADGRDTELKILLPKVAFKPRSTSGEPAPKVLIVPEELPSFTARDKNEEKGRNSMVNPEYLTLKVLNLGVHYSRI